jgi:glycosyltransferase involved in cell wall biosynthesis
VRVCHFSATTLEGAYFGHIARGLAAAGHEFECGTLGGEPPPAWLASTPGCRYFRLNSARREQWPSAAVRLARRLRARRIDVLQTHLVHGAIVGTAAARLARTPLLVHMRHHIDDVRLSGGRLHVELDRALARAADEVIVPSHAAKRYLVAEEGIDAGRIHVIHLGFDTDALSGSDADGLAVRRTLGIEDGAFVAGCVARFSPNKGHRFLFAALARLAEERPDARLLLVGQGDPAPYRAEARTAGVVHRTLFLGTRSDVPSCLRAMDVVVLPSLSESFNQVIIEALAAERPLVATDVGGAREVLTDEANALLVPPGDVDALHRALRRVAFDGDLRARLRANARPSIERFSVARMVEGHLTVYARTPRSRDVAQGRESESPAH